MKTSYLYFCILLLGLSSCKKQSSGSQHPEVVHYENKESFTEHSKSRGSVDELFGEITDNKIRNYQPYYPVKMEIYENKFPSFKSFVAKYSFKSPYRAIIGFVTDDERDLDATNQLLSNVHRSITENLKQRELMTNEILTKVIAYRELKVGQKVIVPVVTAKGTCKLVAYRVDVVLDLFGGMPAFGLVPKSNTDEVPSILLFRGTDLSGRGFASIMADLDLNGPGYRVFQGSQEKIRNWLIKVDNQYSMKARVMGFSLGGALVQYACILESKYISKDPHFPNVAFNQPGLSEDMVNKWNKMHVADRAPFIGYITEGDVVSSVGKLIGYVSELSTNVILEPIAAHLTLMSAENRLYSYRIDVTLKYGEDQSAQSSVKKSEIFSLKASEDPK